jgi:hypothetical protein
MHKCRGEVGRGAVGGRRETTCSFAAPRPFRVRLPPFGRRPRLQDDRCGAGRLIQRLVLKSALTTAGPGALAPERRPVTTRHTSPRVGWQKRFAIRLRAVRPSARYSGSCCPGSCTRRAPSSGPPGCAATGCKRQSQPALTARFMRTLHAPFGCGRRTGGGMDGFCLRPSLRPPIHPRILLPDSVSHGSGDLHSLTACILETERPCHADDLSASRDIPVAVSFGLILEALPK